MREQFELLCEAATVTRACQLNDYVTRVTTNIVFTSSWKCHKNNVLELVLDNWSLSASTQTR